MKKYGCHSSCVTYLKQMLHSLLQVRGALANIDIEQPCPFSAITTFGCPKICLEHEYNLWLCCYSLDLRNVRACEGERWGCKESIRFALFTGLNGCGTELFRSEKLASCTIFHFFPLTPGAFLLCPP